MKRVRIWRVVLALAGALALSGCQGLLTRPSSPAPDPAQVAKTAPEPPLRPAPQPRQAPPQGAEPTAPRDLWERLRRGFSLAVTHPRVDTALERYWGQQRSVDEWARRAAPFLHLVTEQVEDRGLPAELALVPVVESHYDPEAYSRFHAAGLWQIIPVTGKRFGLRQDRWFDGRHDPVSATRAALDYLEHLHATFDGDWLLALAAYNAGEGTVLRAMARNREAARTTDYWSLDLPPQTRQYIPKLLAVAALVRDPEGHGIRLPRLADEPALTLVDLPAAVDLELAAELSRIDADELRRLNPGYRRWVTPVDGPHHLLMPTAQAGTLRAALQDLPRERWVRWHRHQVRPGDSLYVIARRYGVRVADVRTANGLSRDLIHPGQTLRVPKVAPRGAPRDPQQDSEDTAAYRVRPGDSLWTIARAHDTTIKALRRLNGLRPGAVLRPGEALRVAAAGGGPARGAADVTGDGVRHRVRSGESLWVIARRFGVSVDALRRWNGLEANAVLRPGQVLVVRSGPTT